MMEFNISDLLDDLTEVKAEIRPNTDASAKRIRELTMKKIHSEKKFPRRSLSTVSKALVAAAILASLALPVMAAAGLHFTDWLEGLAKENTEEYQVRYSSWEQTEGFWQVSLTAKDLTREGMTLVCREVQDSPVTGSLEVQGGYWLERWNGEAFEEIPASAQIPAEESRELRDGDSFEMEVNWQNIYGSLESGRYRLYKIFTYAYTDGKIVELIDWAEFRIFNGDMTPYINQCKDALDELLHRKSSHIDFTSYYYDASAEKVSGYDLFEIWRNGENYLLRHTMENYGTDRSVCWGQMLLGEEAYEINSWNSEDILSGAAQWEYDELLSTELNQFDDWYFFLTMNETQVGEIWVEGNEIIVLESYYVEGNGDVYQEYTYRFDANGNLIGGEINYLPEPWCAEEEKRLSSVLVVHETSADETANVIAAQNVGQPDSFSWAEEQAQNLSSGTGVKTEGFVNTTPKTITTGYDAFLLAFNDYEAVAHHASHVSYDTDADMWRVEFWWKNGNIHSIVYLDGNGITRMTVTGPYES